MKWEYKSVVLYVDPVADELNHYGQDGWELVELRDTVLVQVETMTSGEVIIAYFKRPLPEPEAKPPKGKLMTSNLLGYPPEIVHGEVKPVQSEADRLRLELADANAFNERLDDHISDLLDVIKPFVDMRHRNRNDQEQLIKVYDFTRKCLRAEVENGNPT